MGSPVLFRKEVVRFLSSNRFDLLAGVTDEEWHRNLRWLDRSGLALPLAERLEALEDRDRFPEQIKGELRRRLLDNEKRMESMLRYFQEANHALEASGIRYCCVKGFTLVPDCFGSIKGRHQVDLDFLVAPQDVDRAQAAIETLGYRVQRAGNSGEMRFTKPWKKHLGVNAYLYQMPEPPPIEFHTKVWEPEAGVVDFCALSGFLDSTQMHEVRGVQFPRLRPARQFVYLVLHVFRHLLGSWTRLLSLYEIACFIRTHDSDAKLWLEVSNLVSSNDSLASACALVIALVELTFPIGSNADMPQSLRRLCATHLSMESELWVESYSTACLFTDPPGNKLSLLVQKQYCSDTRVWRQYLWSRLLPVRRAHDLSDHVDKAAKATLGYRVEDLLYKISRLWYHVRSGCEYLLARLRWKQLMRMQSRSAHRVVDEF